MTQKQKPKGYRCTYCNKLIYSYSEMQKDCPKARIKGGSHSVSIAAIFGWR